MIQQTVLVLTLCISSLAHASDVPPTPQSAFAFAEELVTNISDTAGITELEQIFAMVDAVAKVESIDRLRASDAVARAFQTVCKNRMPCKGVRL
jgi:hypothetical protein